MESSMPIKIGCSIEEKERKIGYSGWRGDGTFLGCPGGSWGRI